MNDDLLKEALAYIPQGSVSDHQKFGMLRLCERMDWFIPVVEAHDSLLSEVPIGREKEYAEIFTEELQKPINYRDCCISRDFDLTVPVELSIGETWGSMAPLKI
jgi:DNA polymerase I-like protein with 3'-5' exonuclease and polymerase domains